jgi:hypothetical protein
VQLLWKEFCSPQRTIEQQGRPNEGALLALIKELDAGAADLDALLEFANAAPIRLSSAVAKCIPIGHRRGWKPAIAALSGHSLLAVPTSTQSQRLAPAPSRVFSFRRPPPRIDRSGPYVQRRSSTCRADQRFHLAKALAQ